MTPQEVLLKAADWLETHEWCQGRYTLHNAKCAVGAISKVSRTGSQVRAASDLLKLKTGNPPSLEAWNDAPGRTKSEVIASMRRTAE